MADKVEAILALRGGGQLSVGRERIALLEAVGKHGSITKAAEAMGYSYKYACDSIAAINNLLPRPAIHTQTGGRKGGGATLTEDGRRLIVAFHGLEAKLARITAAMADEGLDELPDLMFWNAAMRTSARNVFRCRVVEVKRSPVSVEVVLQISDKNILTAVITHQSAEDLALTVGQGAVALVKASSVMLARTDSDLRLSVANRFTGTVMTRIDGQVDSELVLDIGDGKTISSVITRDGVEDLDLHPGDTAVALFKASQVILAVN